MALSMSGTLLVALAFGGVSFFLPRFLISPMSKFKTDKRVGVDDKQSKYFILFFGFIKGCNFFRRLISHITKSAIIFQ